MTLSYTSFEPPPVFAIGANGAWTEYDLFNLQGVPKGAIAEIVCANKNVDNERMAGVRTDGSGINNRILDLHEAEGGGVTAGTMFVKCDSSTGLIECYAEIAADVDFYLLGYFEGCNFTESFATFGPFILGWDEQDLTGDGVPANAVCQVVLFNSSTSAVIEMGTRKKGSGLQRTVFLDEAEDFGWNSISMIVKADGDSVIEIYTDNIIGEGGRLLGWFSSVVDFDEGWTWYESPSKEDGSWVSRTITEAPANSIVAFALVHQDSGNETNCGLRTEGGSQERKILEHEQEGGGGGGFQACITLDASKKCEVLCDDSSESLFYYTGYFSDIGEPPEGWTGKIIGVTNPTKIMGVAVADIAKVMGVA